MITAQSSLFEVLMCHLPNSPVCPDIIPIAGDFNQLCLHSTHAACLIMILALWLCSHSIFWSHPDDLRLYDVYPMAWLLAVRLYYNRKSHVLDTCLEVLSLWGSMFFTDFNGYQCFEAMICCSSCSSRQTSKLIAVLAVPMIHFKFASRPSLQLFETM